MIDLTFLMFASLFSGFWVSLFTIVFFIVCILSVSNENFYVGVFAFFIYNICLTLFTPLNPFIYVYTHPVDVVLFVLLYLSIGGVYSILKYRNWLSGKLASLRRVKQLLIDDYKLSISVTEQFPERLPDGSLSSTVWKDYIHSNLGWYDAQLIAKGKLKPSDQFDSIFGWIAFWPFSAIGLFIADPLRWLVTKTYESLSAIYRDMYTRLISKYININDI